MSLPSLLCFGLFSWNTSEKASGFSSARRDFTLHVRGRRRIVNEALITNVALFLPGLKNPSGDDSCSINFSLLFAGQESWGNVRHLKRFCNLQQNNHSGFNTHTRKCQLVFNFKSFSSSFPVLYKILRNMSWKTLRRWRWFYFGREEIIP